MHRSSRPADERLSGAGGSSGLCSGGPPRGGPPLFPRTTASLRRTGIPGSPALSRPHRPRRADAPPTPNVGLTNYTSVTSLFSPIPTEGGEAGRQANYVRLIRDRSRARLKTV